MNINITYFRRGIVIEALEILKPKCLCRSDLRYENRILARVTCKILLLGLLVVHFGEGNRHMTR